MGNESSSPAKAKNEPVEETMPYSYSYSSVSKGSSAATSRSGSGDLKVGQGAGSQGGLTDKGNLSGARRVSGDASPSKGVDPRNNMITVSTNKRVRKVDPAIQALEKIPKFLPIIGTSVGSAVEKSAPVIDERHLTCICNRYKDHLNNSSAIISKRQQKIGERVRWVERNANARASLFGKTAQSLHKCEMKLADVYNMQNQIHRIADLMKRVCQIRLLVALRVGWCNKMPRCMLRKIFQSILGQHCM
eukprot:m.117976 g.117976  ORF g.117976 m.117976 type:complete len:247 (-) comp17192_c0_seq4:104-844(-)